MITFVPPIPNSKTRPTYEVFSNNIYLGILVYNSFDNFYVYKPIYPKDRSGISPKSLEEIWNALKILNEQI